MFAFIKTPVWERADDDTKAGFVEIIEQLGAQVEEVELFPSAEKAWEWHRTIMSAEMAANLEGIWEKSADKISEKLRSQLEAGRKVLAVDYQRALRQITPMQESFVELFEQRYDAIVTPAAPSAAPKGIISTGDPGFCTLWTLCGMPCVSLPLLQSSDTLPIGVQLVGARNGDAKLLRTARWLAANMAAT
jgi:Asp-tRNA(Asn)/Glu-tRNA(Gln) amidotransferase A subunit family amidase